MIHVWLKIKMRTSLDYTLRYLNYWLGEFSDTDKYKIYIYSEDVDLPYYYNSYTILRKPDLLKDNDCQLLFNLVNNSNTISQFWKPAAFALLAPYYYLKDGYVFNIDADDMMVYNAKYDFYDNVCNKLIEYNLTTMSFDYMFSKHLFPLKNIFPHFWSFGINIADVKKMKQLCHNAVFVNNIEFEKKYNTKLDKKHQICVDFLVAEELFKLNPLYLSFITNANFSHAIFFESYCNTSDKCINIKFTYKNRIIEHNVNLHHKTLII